ncbi:MAG: hypothetical protein ACLT8E_02000 [Akkermansia sp.]
MKNASTITAFIISFLVVGSLALVFLFLGNREEEPPLNPRRKRKFLRARR